MTGIVGLLGAVSTGGGGITGISICGAGGGFTGASGILISVGGATVGGASAAMVTLSTAGVAFGDGVVCGLYGDGLRFDDALWASTQQVPASTTTTAPKITLRIVCHIPILRKLPHHDIQSEIQPSAVMPST
jgi:hypothetical protein